MNPTIPCLQTEAIDSLLTGQLTPEELTTAEEHLTRCGTCRQRIERTVGSHQWWDEACQALASGDRVALDDGDSLKTIQPGSPTDRLLAVLGPSDDPRMLGRIGPYEVVGLIGQGGMGIVFKGFDAALNRYVAIKMLLPHLATSGAARKRFAREAQAAAAVVDDHVVPIHYVAEWQGVPYFVMPYTRGLSLQKRLDQEGPLELREILRIGLQTSRGLAAAHAQGLVHRDVKPANILLDEGVERAALVDFGLARAADDASLTQSGMLAGTPQYMSPEQARGEMVDQQSDLFSLGSVLYAMCTGHAPFRAETSYGVLRRITDEEPRPIREINPEIPEWLCRIISRLMSKDPSERFESASEIAELLETCLAHVQQPAAASLPEQLHDPEPSPGAGRRRWTAPTWIAAMAFALVVLLASILVVLELNKGTLTIESDADDVSLRITQGDTVVEKGLTVTRSGKKLRVAAGTYVVEIEGEADGITVENENVTLERGGTEIVRIVRDTSDGSAPRKASEFVPKKNAQQPREYNSSISPTAENIWRAFGVILRPVSQAGMPNGYEGGLIISDVRQDGPAAQAGLQKGDAIIGLGKEKEPASPIKLLKLLFALTDASDSEFEGREVKVYFLRQAEPRETTVTLDFGQLPPDAEGNGRASAIEPSQGELQEAHSSPTGDPVREAVRDLGGVWRLESRSFNAQERDDDVTGTLTFRGNQFRSTLTTPFRDDDLRTRQFKHFSINPTQSPAEINLYDTNFLVQGIYKLEGDQLTLAAFARSEVGRPRGFTVAEAQPDGQTTGTLVVMTFRRLEGSESEQAPTLEGDTEPPQRTTDENPVREHGEETAGLRARYDIPGAPEEVRLLVEETTPKAQDRFSKQQEIPSCDTYVR